MKGYVFSVCVAVAMHTAALAVLTPSLPGKLCAARPDAVQLLSKCVAVSDHAAAMFLAVILALLLTGIPHMLNSLWPRSGTAAFYLPAGIMAGFGAIIWSPMSLELVPGLNWGGMAYIGFFTVPYAAGVLGLITRRMLLETERAPVRGAR